MRCVCRRELAVVAYRHIGLDDRRHRQAESCRTSSYSSAFNLSSRSHTPRAGRKRCSLCKLHPPVGQTIRTHLQRRYQEVVYQRIVCTSAQIMCKRAARARPRHIVSFSKPLRKGLVSLSGSSTRIIRPQYQAWHLHGLTATHSLDPVGDSRIMATPFDRRHWNQNGYGICYCCCSCCFCCCCRCCSCHRYCRTFLSPQKSSTSEQ